MADVTQAEIDAAIAKVSEVSINPDKDGKTVGVSSTYDASKLMQGLTEVQKLIVNYALTIKMNNVVRAPHKGELPSQALTRAVANVDKVSFWVTGERTAPIQTQTGSIKGDLALAQATKDGKLAEISAAGEATAQKIAADKGITASITNVVYTKLVGAEIVKALLAAYPAINGLSGDDAKAQFKVLQATPVAEQA
jgi:hypothetical protein